MSQCFFNQKYKVFFSDFSVRKYRKSFSKKYGKKAWNITEISIKESLERIANIEGKDILSFICNTNNNTIFAKYSFRIANSNICPKTSGNRCILEICNTKRRVEVLFIYCKSHIPSKERNETNWWKKVVSDNFDRHCLKYNENR